MKKITSNRKWKKARRMFIKLMGKRPFTQDTINKGRHIMNVLYRSY